MNDLATLENRLQLMTRTRNNMVNTARAQIASANEWFDRNALPLQREIDRLRRELEPPPVARVRHRVDTSLEGTEDWSEEERAHFVSLVTGNKS